MRRASAPAWDVGRPALQRFRRSQRLRHRRRERWRAGDRRLKCRSGQVREDRRSAHAAAAHTKGTRGRTTNAAEGRKSGVLAANGVPLGKPNRASGEKWRPTSTTPGAMLVSEPAADHALKNNSAPPATMPKIREPSRDRVAAALPNAPARYNTDVADNSSPSEYVARVHRNMGAHTAMAAIAIDARHESPKTERANSTTIVPNRAASMKMSGMAASNGSPR